MIIALVLVSVLLALSIFANYKLATKFFVVLDDYEDIAQDILSNEEFVLRLRNVVIEMNDRLHEIDSRGSFEADDEVGYFFDQLKEIIEDINNEFIITEEEE